MLITRQVFRFLAKYSDIILSRGDQFESLEWKNFEATTKVSCTLSLKLKNKIKG